MNVTGIDLIGLLVAGASLGLIFLLKRLTQNFPPPSLRISSLAHLFRQQPTTKQTYEGLPMLLMWTALLFVLLAMIDPHLYVERKKGPEKYEMMKEQEIPREGIALYLVIDISGSMQGPISSRKSISKLEFTKGILSDFVKQRPKDLLGLIAFARGATVLSPLTLDHEALLAKIQGLSPVETQEFDGTAIGYAIYKTVNLISSTRYFAEAHQEKEKPPYDIKSVGLVLLTDGLQNPNELDSRNPLRNIELADAATYARENHVKIYLINIGSDIFLDKYKAHRHVVAKMSETTGGKFYTLSNPNQLSEIFNDINTLETSRITEKVFALPKEQQPDKYRRISFYPWLLMGACICLLVAIFLEGIWLKRIP